MEGVADLRLLPHRQAIIYIYMYVYNRAPFTGAHHISRISSNATYNIDSGILIETLAIQYVYIYMCIYRYIQ